MYWVEAEGEPVASKLGGTLDPGWPNAATGKGPHWDTTTEVANSRSLPQFTSGRKKHRTTRCAVPEWFFSGQPALPDQLTCWRVFQYATLGAFAIQPRSESVRLAFLAAGSIVLAGDGIAIEKITQGSSGQIALQVHVAADAKIGRRDLRVLKASKAASLTIFDKIDYILVLPEKAMPRLGGVRAVKRFIQFEAHAFSSGPDGIPGNSDDLDLGMIKASWSISEPSTSSGAQNTKYVGTIDQAGLFTPAGEGPNAERFRSTNNAGDVWVNASYTPDGSATALSARAYVLVSVPDYRELITP